jgi:small subunit ribosomal protein S14
MARKALVNKCKSTPKFAVRKYTRCNLCGRPHAFIRDFGICRLCFRKLAHLGEIPGIKKSSW